MALATAGKFGIGFTPNDRNVYNRSGGAVAVGDTLAFDTVGTQSSDAIYGSETSAYSNMVTPNTLASHVRGGFVGVVTSLRGGTGANGSKVTVRVTGKVTANVTNDEPTTGDLEQGDVLYINGSDNEMHGDGSAPATSKKIFAIFDDLTLLAPTASGLREITMDGIHGFGST